MTKQEFLAQLRNGLSGLPHEDIEERLGFFNEMIEDRMEEGLSEEEAVSAAGSVEDIVAQTVSEIPLARIAKERIKPKRELKNWEIVLIILGAPIWFSLAVSAASVLFSIYMSLWAVIISLWAVFVSLIASSLACLVAGIFVACCGHFTAALGLISACFVCTGLSIFMFYGCKAITYGIYKLTKKFALWVKNCFIKKEKV